MKNKNKTLQRLGVIVAALLLFASGMGLGSYLALDHLEVKVLGRCMFTLPESFQVPERN